MHLLFIADPLASFKIHKDSTFAMMREAARRGHQLWFCESKALFWQSGGPVSTQAQLLRLCPGASPWYEAQPSANKALTNFDAILMRTDPPVDSEYLYATHLLTQAQREGARVFNDPQALREHSEKLALMEFAPLLAPTLVTRDRAAMRAFHAQHGDIILKPLDGMGGMGVFRVGTDGLNLGSIIESLNGDGERTIMLQRYVPEIAQGDKRVLLIDGKPLPYALARIPQGQEIRGNLAAGGKGVAQALSPLDLAIAEQLGPTLAARGLFLVGLDIIGSCLTEINVTSPTCFQEITDQTSFDVAACFMDALEKHLTSSPL